MDISFDPAKNASNIDVHGISFERTKEFDWSLALILEDTRRDYGERRYCAVGPIEGRLHVLVFTPRNGRIHVISLRKANQREIRQYDSQAPSQPHIRGP